MLDDPDQKGLEFDKLNNFTTIMFETIKVDMHKKQFSNIGAVKKQISAW